MNDSSPLKARSRPASASLENPAEPFTTIRQMPLPLDRTKVTIGHLNDSHLIRAALVESIRLSGKSRTLIAEEMSYLVGREVTERMLNAFTAESKEEHRWPAELDRAFCVATANDKLLRCRAEAAGYTLISGTEVYLLELGRQYLQRKRSEAEMAELERRLEEGGL